MRAAGIILGVLAVGLLAVVSLLFYSPGLVSKLRGGVRGKYLQEQQHYAQAFGAGDTNVPLFAMDYFEPTVHFCRINQAGKGAARRDVGHAIQAGVSIALDKPRLQALVATLQQLPPPPQRLLPPTRQIVVGCVRSNQWFQAVYDRADIPSPLEKIAELTGASLPWYIPKVQGRRLVGTPRGTFLSVATEAPIAVSGGEGFVEIWDLNSLSQEPVSRLKFYPGRLSLSYYEHSVAITPDGLTIAAATHYELWCLDWRTGKILWKTSALEHEGYDGRHLVIGNQGRTLFAGGAHTLERWDLMTGQKEAVLVTNAPDGDGMVRLLKVSRNGKVVLAGLDKNVNARPHSFIVWEVARNEPALRFTDAEGAQAYLSPDGEWIALSRFAADSLELFKWRTGEKRQVRLRNADGGCGVDWSPDGTRLAAHVDSYPESVIIYDTASWKPIAHWLCGRIGEGSEFSFGQTGRLYQLRGGEINALDVAPLKRLTAE